MTVSEMRRLLKKHGWHFQEGKRHTLVTHPDKPGIHFPLPRHPSKELTVGVQDSILKMAGLK